MIHGTKPIVSKRSSPWLHAACFILTAAALGAAEDIVVADFEGRDYAPWTATGEAFGPGPAKGTLSGQMRVSGFNGAGLVNSFHGGDDSTGSLTSPEFRIERRFIKFLIGGGKNSETTCMNLWVDGKVVRSATGPNDKPGGSEALAPGAWDVGGFAGKTAVIQIVDQARGGWGHINVDQIILTNRKPPLMISDAARDLVIEKRYLHIPIQNGAPKRKVTTLVDGRVEVVNDIELADGMPDWWAFMDVGAWRGKTVTIRVDELRDDSKALDSIEQGDTIKDSANLYQEALRGQLHFSPRRGWNNDPNGMVFFNGEYHLFYQHNPYGWGWGNMHWGHAVSRDLVRWREIGVPLAPDRFGPMFSGSAVVDWKNTSGLGKDGKPPLVLLYTAAGDPTVQCIASSTDGRDFTKFPGNPVIPQITGGNRDPKVLWHEPTQRWVMVLYVTLPGEKHTVHFLTSPNLREWTRTCIVEGGTGGDKFLYECPDFFELLVDGDPADRKWVLLGADSNYAIGSFDGTTFKPEHTRLPGHRGRGFYAAQTFSDIPAADGRRIQIGWFQTETKGMPFNQSMSIPLELGLTSTPDGPRMTMKPVKELASLRAKSKRFEPLELTPGADNPLAGNAAELVEMTVEFEPVASTQLTLDVRGAAIVYDARTQELIVNRHRVPAPLFDGRQRLRIFCDRTGLEVFASDGLTYVPMPFQPKAADLSLGLQAAGGSARITLLEVHELDSIWKKPTESPKE